MSDIIFDFDCTNDSKQPPELSLVNIFRNIIETSVEEFMPQYLESFPFLKGRCIEYMLQDEIMILKINYEVHMNMIFFGSLKDEILVEKIKKTNNIEDCITYSKLKNILGSKYLNYNTFTYFVKTNNGSISLENFNECIIDWLNNDVVPYILEINQKRVLDAIPTPPLFNIKNINENVFILEDETAIIQGTCFYIKELGFVTCYHVLFDKYDKAFTDMFMFCHNDINKKYKIKINRKNKDIDVAIFELIDCEKIFSGIEQGTADDINQMDHIGVAGFPNYRIGDSGILSPGLVIGFRTYHGIRRLLVNVPIISGNSGGPILDSNNKVIGIAVTGADCMENADKTDNHGVIPIDALKYI